MAPRPIYPTLTFKEGDSTSHIPVTDAAREARSSRRVFAVVVFLLFSSGWATNHFSTMVAVLRDQEHFSALVVNGAFGIYALGLVPCLLLGGIFADRYGPRFVVLTGATAAAVGNLVLLLGQTPAGLFLGRFVIGLGVGLVISAGTAWAAQLRGANGAVLAGIVLSAGFAIGPIVSGALAYGLPSAQAMSVPFIVAIVLSSLAVLATASLGRPAAAALSPAGAVSQPSEPVAGGEVRRALVTSIPMALWVFSTAAIALVTLTERVGTWFDAGVLLPGFAAFLVFAAALVGQTLARRFGWGPISGVVGALIAAVGLIFAALSANIASLWIFIVAAVLLGIAYGLCLREGLMDVETYTPPARRGTTLGVYYVFTYLGFALPVLLEWMRPATGTVLPLLILGGLAVVSAVLRALQMRSGVLDR